MRLSKTQNFIDTTKEEFQQYQEEPISDSQAADIQNNLFGVMDLLLKWKNVFKEESRKILQRIKQLLGAKDKQADLDLMLNNEEETDTIRMKNDLPFFR